MENNNVEIKKFNEYVSNNYENIKNSFFRNTKIAETPDNLEYFSDLFNETYLKVYDKISNPYKNKIENYKSYLFLALKFNHLQKCVQNNKNNSKFIEITDNFDIIDEYNNEENRVLKENKICESIEILKKIKKKCFKQFGNEFLFYLMYKQIESQDNIYNIKEFCNELNLDYQSTKRKFFDYKKFIKNNFSSFSI